LIPVVTQPPVICAIGHDYRAVALLSVNTKEAGEGNIWFTTGL